MRYFKERDLREVIRRHIEAEESEVDRLEGIGAMNFLALDDVAVTGEGEHVHPDSVLSLPTRDGTPVFPDFERRTGDPFLQSINRSGKKWIILVDEHRQPCLVLNSNAFLRACLFGDEEVSPEAFCHRPIVVTDAATLLGKVVSRFRVHPVSDADDVIDDDLILLWSEERRVITGSDILGRLLHGIAMRDIAAAST